MLPSETNLYGETTFVITFTYILLRWISVVNLKLYAGDIISDLCAGLIGGLGLTPSGNIGTTHHEKLEKPSWKIASSTKLILQLVRQCVIRVETFQMHWNNWHKTLQKARSCSATPIKNNGKINLNQNQTDTLDYKSIHHSNRLRPSRNQERKLRFFWFFQRRCLWTRMYDGFFAIYLLRNFSGSFRCKWACFDGGSTWNCTRYCRPR